MKDTGSDPMENGMFKMFPSGDIVDFEEQQRRLPPVDMGNRSGLIFGRTNQEIAQMQNSNSKTGTLN